MKPKIKFMDGYWFCGGLFVEPWYVDWAAGKSIKEAYDNWVRISGNCRTRANLI